MRKRIFLVLVCAFALGTLGFVPVCGAQDAELTDTETEVGADPGTTAVALTWAISGEVPELLEGLLGCLIGAEVEVEGASSGQVSFVKAEEPLPDVHSAPATTSDDDDDYHDFPPPTTGYASTSGTTYASRTLESGNVIEASTDGGTSAEAAGFAPLENFAVGDTAYAVGLLTAGGAKVELDFCPGPEVNSALGLAVSGSAVSTRAGAAEASSYGDALVALKRPFLLLDDDDDDFETLGTVAVRNTETHATAFSGWEPTYAASAGLVLSVGGFARINGVPAVVAFSGVNSIGVVDTEMVLVPHFDGIMGTLGVGSGYHPPIGAGAFEAAASGEAEVNIERGVYTFNTLSAGETYVYGSIPAGPPEFIPEIPVGPVDVVLAGLFPIEQVIPDGTFNVVRGDVWAHSGKNALLAAYGGGGCIPPFAATVATVDTFVLADDHYGPGNEFSAKGYAFFRNGPTGPDPDPLAVISELGDPVVASYIGNGPSLPAEGQSYLVWTPPFSINANGGSTLEWTATGSLGVSAAVFSPAFGALATTDFAAASYANFYDIGGPPSVPNLIAYSTLENLWGGAGTPFSTTALENASAGAAINTMGPFLPVWYPLATSGNYPEWGPNLPEPEFPPDPFNAYANSDFFAAIPGIALQGSIVVPPLALGGGFSIALVD